MHAFSGSLARFLSQNFNQGWKILPYPTTPWCRPPAPQSKYGTPELLPWNPSQMCQVFRIFVAWKRWNITILLQTNHMGVEPKIRGGPPKSSILMGFSIINHPFWGTSFLETPILTIWILQDGFETSHFDEGFFANLQPLRVPDQQTLCNEDRSLVGFSWWPCD